METDDRRKDGGALTARADIRPLLLGESDAARYLGIGATTLRKKVCAGSIRRRLLDGRKLYDVRDLDAFANELPYEGESEGENSCDAAFV